MTSQDFFAFFRNITPQEPQKQSGDNDNIYPLHCDEIQTLSQAPFASALIAPNPPFQDYDKKDAVYLYVVMPTECRYMLEKCKFARKIHPFDASPVIHHTNLTGGQPACCGGEVCFTRNDEVYVNGASGRYPPSNLDELLEAAKLFKYFGFHTYCLGWDEETERPYRIYHKEKLILV